MFELSNVALAVLPFAYLWADRFIGGGYGWERLGRDNGGPLRGGGGPYALALLLPLSYLAGGVPLLAGAIAWGIWRRGFGWRLAGHSAMTPGPDGILAAFVRHSFAAMALGLGHLVLTVNGWGPALTAQLVASLVFAAGATWLARELAEQRLHNAQLEPARGLLFGLLMVASVILSTPT